MKKRENKTQNKSALFSVYFLLVFVLLIPSVCAQIEELNAVDPCQIIHSMPFTSQVSDTLIIDQAVKCGETLTNEQFKMASKEMQEAYVLNDTVETNKVNFTDTEQSSVFIRTILKSETQINDSTKYSIKQFLTYNENYSFQENITNKSVKDVFEKIANNSIGTINEINVDGQNNIAYLRYFNLTSKFLYVNANFDYYENDTGIFVTNGPRSSRFTMKNVKYFEMQGYSDFFIKSDGRLNAKNYLNKEICTDCDYYISPDGKTINVQSGRFNLNDKSFTSDNPYIINVKDNQAYEVTSEVANANIWGVNPDNSEILFKANGKITVVTDDHYILGDDTKYTQYQKNQPLFDLYTKKTTDLFTTNDPIKLETYDYDKIMSENNGEIIFNNGGNTEFNPCKNAKESCIYWNPANNGIDANIQNNLIEMHDSSSIASYLHVAQIEGKDSGFNYYVNNGTLEFTESAVNEKGNHELFPSYTAEITEDGKQYTIASDSGSVMTCASPCKTSGTVTKTPANKPLPNKPENKVDSVLIIVANPFEGTNTVNKSKPITVMGRYVEKRVASALAGKIAVYSTSEEYSPPATSTDKFKMNPGKQYKLNKDKQMPNPDAYKNTVVLITGHHRYGDGEIYSEHRYFGDELANYMLAIKRGLSVQTSVEKPMYDLQYNPNVLVVMFSACNTVKSPKTISEYGGYQGYGTYGRNLIFDLNKSYPNLRLIIGYDNIAPGQDFIYDTYLDGSLKDLTDSKDIANYNAYLSKLFVNPKTSGLVDFTILENGGFEAFGEHALSLYNVDLQGLDQFRQQNKKSDDAIDSDRYEFSKRVAYYYKDSDGSWYFHTNYAYDSTTNKWINKPVKIKVNTGQFIGIVD